VSFQYDQYLARHRANVKRGFDWLSENLPGLMTNTLTALFWVIWIIVIGLCVFGFYYIDNEWIEN
jgi:hypothetical protein